MAWIRNWHQPTSGRGRQTAVQYVAALFNRARVVDSPDSWASTIKLLFRRMYKGQEQELVVELYDSAVQDIVLTAMRWIVIEPLCPVRDAAQKILNNDIQAHDRETLIDHVATNYGVRIPSLVYANWHSVSTCSLCKSKLNDLKQQFIQARTVL